jgi:hypothetical protein
MGYGEVEPFGDGHRAFVVVLGDVMPFVVDLGHGDCQKEKKGKKKRNEKKNVGPIFFSEVLENETQSRTQGFSGTE